MKRKPKQYEDDDGRVIVNMNVEGMPWYDRGGDKKEIRGRKVSGGQQITRSESRLYTWYALLYAMGIAAVFSLTWVLFILFCTQVWFK